MKGKNDYYFTIGWAMPETITIEYKGNGYKTITTTADIYEDEQTSVTLNIEKSILYINSLPMCLLGKWLLRYTLYRPCRKQVL